MYRLVVQNDKQLPSRLLSKLRSLPIVESVATAQPVIAQLPEQKLSFGQSTVRNADWGLKQVHQLYSSGIPEVVVAVLDTGVNVSHRELQECILPGYDFVNIIEGSDSFYGDKLGEDDNPEDDLVGHGTHVAGIVAAKGVNMNVGVAPRCKILPVRVLGSMKQGRKYVGAGMVEHINAGIKWAVDNGATIINMSLGVEHSGGGLPHKEAIEYAVDKGVTIVAASGNDGTQNLYYPGALPNVIAVGASRTPSEIAPFSTYGKVSITAPGENIYSASVNNTYAFASGTSQAAPRVAGIIALLKSFALSKGVKLTTKQVKQVLKHSSDRPFKGLYHQKWGYGHINSMDALNYLDYKLKQ